MFLAASCSTQCNPILVQARVNCDIQQAVLKRLKRKPLIFSTHALERMKERGMTVLDVENVLGTGRLLKKESRFG
jgi:hypothetical protein